MKSESSKKDLSNCKSFNRISISNERYPIVTDLNIALIDLKYEKINYDEVAILYTELEKSLSEIVKLKSRYKEDLLKFNITGLMGKSKCEDLKESINNSKPSFEGTLENSSNPSSSNISNGSYFMNGTDSLSLAKNNYEQGYTSSDFKLPLNKKIRGKNSEKYKNDYEKRKIDIQKLNLECNIDVPNEFWNVVDLFFNDINESQISKMTKLLVLAEYKAETLKPNQNNDLNNIPPLGKRRYLQKCNKHRKKFKVLCPKCEIVFLNKPQNSNHDNFKENELIKKQESLMDLDNENFGLESPFKVLTCQMVNSLVKESMGSLEGMNINEDLGILPGEKTSPINNPHSMPLMIFPSDRFKNLDSNLQISDIRSLFARPKECLETDEVLDETHNCQERLKALSGKLRVDQHLAKPHRGLLPPTFVRSQVAAQGLRNELVTLDEEIKELYKKHRKSKLKKKEISKQDADRLEKKLVERETLCVSLCKFEE